MEGQFNGRFFVLRVWGAYIWRGLFSEFYGKSFYEQQPYSLVRSLKKINENRRKKCLGAGPEGKSREMNWLKLNQI